MKSKLLSGILLSASAALMLFPSCSPSSGEATQTITYPALNFVTLNDGTSSMSWGSYTFNLNFTEGKESVSTSNLIVDNSTYTFATNGVTYEDCSNGVYAGNLMGNIGSSTQLSDCDFFFGFMSVPTGIEYFPAKRWIPRVETGEGSNTIYHPGATYRPDYDTPPIVVGKYKAGNLFKVVTCSTDMSFFGTTVTKYPGGEFSNDKMIYRIFLDIKKKTADVVLYDAKFAELAPSLVTVYLPSLALTLKDGAYEIEGSDIVPLVPEGTGVDGTLVENPRYTFKSFKLSTVDGTLLSTIKVEYKVGEAFSGEFTGKYVNLPEKMME